MGFWTNNQHRAAFDFVEDLTYPPSGGRVKMWPLGIGVALIPLGYGVYCLLTGEARFLGRRGSHLDLVGAPAVALAIAYISVGLFIHAHWFWGLHPKLERWSYLLKGLALVVFLGAFVRTIYEIFASV